MMNAMSFSPQLVGEGDVDPFLYTNEAVFVEPKVDGIRAIVAKRGDDIKIYTRGGKDWTDRYKSIVGGLRNEIIAKNAIIDGEIAVIKNKVITYSSIAMKGKLCANEKLVYFPFDLLHIEGYDIFNDPLLHRKQNLKLILSPEKIIQPIPFMCTNTRWDIDNFYKKCLENKMEGIVLKNSGAYKPGSKYNWLKMKPLRTVDLKVFDRKPKKDGQGWIYALEGEGLQVKATSKLDLQSKTMVEVKYDRRFPTSLRFPQILRIREDKYP